MVRKIILITVMLMLDLVLLSGCGPENGFDAEIDPSGFPETNRCTDTEYVTENDAKDLMYEDKTSYVHEEESSQTDEQSIVMGALSGLKICIDPGHGKFARGYQEAIGPGSAETKKAFSTGTAGDYQSEAEFNLKMAYLLKPMLEQHGAEVYMTRSGEEATYSNIGRAQYANDLGCDMVVRIHADGSSDTARNGISMLVPGRNEFITDEYLLSASRICGQNVLDAVIAKTGALDLGVVERTDLTGFNWSAVPSILIECGFMTNSSDDAKLADPSYQQLLAEGITEGLINYFILN